MPDPSSSDALPRSSFAFADDAGFDPDLGDPEAPLPPSVPDSVGAEIRHMYTYVVSLFPQAVGARSLPPPPSALLKTFFVVLFPSSACLLNLVRPCAYCSYGG